MYEQNHEGKPPNFFELLNMLDTSFRLIVHAYASVIYALFRCRFGRNYFGICEFLGILAPLAIVSLMAPEWFPTYVPWLSNVYLILMVFHRVTAKWPEEGVHSRYNGYPRLCKLIPLDEMRIKQFPEPMFVFLLGCGAFFIDRGIGLFLMLGTPAMLFDHAYISDDLNRKVRQICDAEIEDSILMDEVDRKRG